MIKDLEKSITFLNKSGMFKYFVILFDLYNGSAFWQYFINTIIFDFLYCFIKAYLDHIFIYNKLLNDHC